MKWIRALVFILMLLVGWAMTARGQGFQPFPVPPGEQVQLGDYLGYDMHDMWNWVYRSHLNRYYNYYGCYRYYLVYPYRPWYRSYGSFEPNDYWRVRPGWTMRRGFRTWRIR